MAGKGGGRLLGCYGTLARRKVAADSICFHSHQAAEKYLKALLQDRNIHFGKTHDLEGRPKTCAACVPSLTLLAADVQLLNDYAVRYLYPGIDATTKQARSAVRAAGKVRHAAGASAQSPMRILVVDDEKIKRITLADDLAAQGHEVVGAADGEEALEKLAAGPSTSSSPI